MLCRPSPRCIAPTPRATSGYRFRRCNSTPVRARPARDLREHGRMVAECGRPRPWCARTGSAGGASGSARGASAGRPSTALRAATASRLVARRSMRSRCMLVCSTCARIASCCAPQRVAHPGDLFDLPQERDAPIQHGDGLVGMPVRTYADSASARAHGPRRRGQARQRRPLAGHPRAPGCAFPRGELLAQRIGDIAAHVGAAPRLSGLQATEGDTRGRVGQGTGGLDPRLHCVGFQSEGAQLGIVLEEPRTDRLEVASWNWLRMQNGKR